jgi:hypothetical protein
MAVAEATLWLWRRAQPLTFGAGRYARRPTILGFSYLYPPLTPPPD